LDFLGWFRSPNRPFTAVAAWATCLVITALAQVAPADSECPIPGNGAFPVFIAVTFVAVLSVCALLVIGGLWESVAFRTTAVPRSVPGWFTLLGAIGIALSGPTLMRPAIAPHCTTIDLAPLGGVTSVEVVYEPDVHARVSTPARVAAIVGVLNSRLAGWIAPVPEFLRPADVHFVDGAAHDAGGLNFGPGGLVWSAAGGTSYLHYRGQDVEDDARVLCDALEPALRESVCAKSEFFGMEMARPQTRAFVEACNRLLRSADLAKDPCARLVFGRGHFARPPIRFRPGSEERVPAPLRARYTMVFADFPAFTLGGFSGWISRNADGSIALHPDPAAIAPCGCDEPRVVSDRKGIDPSTLLILRTHPVSTE
jgi:hypothetical protein